MNTPSEDEVEVAKEDVNVDYATAGDQNDSKQEGNLDDAYTECEYCGALYISHSKRNRMENMEAHPENYSFGRPCCDGAEDDGYNENLKSEEEEDEEGEDEGENSTSLDSSPTSGVFDAEVARKLIAKMIIVDKLPLKFVNSQGFRMFSTQLLCERAPEFVVPSLPTVVRDIMEIYQNEKRSLRKIFVEQSPRVSLTIDTWTSEHDINYIVITAHFIDINWKMQKKILNFCSIENLDGETIGKEVIGYLMKWGIEKILTLTIDNVCSSDAATALLVQHFKNGLIMDGKFVHVKCCAHILNLIVCDIMKDFHELISKVRNVVWHVRSCSERYSTFEKFIEEENLSSKSVAILDFPDRWDYTYMMLEGSEKLEKAFERLKIHDTTYLEEDIDVPTSSDWEAVRTLVPFLSLFYEATLRLSGSLNVPSNVVFDEISTIRNYITKCSSDSGNLALKDMATKVQVKYDKYWGSYPNTNYLLYVAVVLDPRYKLRFMEYCFGELFEANVAKDMCRKVEDVLRKLFNEYRLSAVNDESSTRGKDCRSNVGESSTKNDFTSAFRFKDMFDAREDDKILEATMEVDIYIMEPLVNQADNFDLLKWWKFNSLRYKVLSKIAQDILAIPVSTVASEYALNISGSVMDSVAFTSFPNLVEALACTNNWLSKNTARVDIREHIEDAIRIEEEFKTNLKAKSTKEVGTMLGEEEDD